MLLLFGLGCISCCGMHDLHVLVCRSIGLTTEQVIEVLHALWNRRRNMYRYIRNEEQQIALQARDIQRQSNVCNPGRVDISSIKTRKSPCMTKPHVKQSSKRVTGNEGRGATVFTLQDEGVVLEEVIEVLATCCLACSKGG